MTEHENQREKRNLNPHRPARCAMWLFGERYAQQRGGSMDFWDKLSTSDKNMCRRFVEQIGSTREETDAELKGTASCAT